MLNYTLIGEKVQQSLKAKKQYQITCVPEKFLSYKDDAKSQKLIVFPTLRLFCIPETSILTLFHRLFCDISNIQYIYLKFSGSFSDVNIVNPVDWVTFAFLVISFPKTVFCFGFWSMIYRPDVKSNIFSDIMPQDQA